MKLIKERIIDIINEEVNHKGVQLLSQEKVECIANRVVLDICPDDASIVQLAEIDTEKQMIARLLEDDDEFMEFIFAVIEMEPNSQAELINSVVENSKSRDYIENTAKIVDNKITDHTDCETCCENYYFMMEDNYHKFSLGLSDVIFCLSIAEKEGVIPTIGSAWWEKISKAL